MYIASDKFDWELHDAMRFRYYIDQIFVQTFSQWPFVFSL